MKESVAFLFAAGVWCLAGLPFSPLMPQARAVVWPANATPEYQPASDEFDALGRAVVELLESKDATRFATNLAVSAKDWRSLISTNSTTDESDRLNTFAKGAGRSVQQLTSDAKAFLSRAEALHLNFSRGDWRCRVVTPKSTGKIYLSENATGRLTLPYLQKLEIVLTAGANANSPTNGDFGLLVRGVEKFPTGWRIAGLQWTKFPSNVADEKTLRELVILEKAANYQGFGGDDDPALLKLGETLVRFIRERDAGAYEKELLLNADLVWSMIQKRGQGGPSRKEVDEEVSLRAKEQVKFAQAAAQVMEDAGVDLKNADIKIESSTIQRCQTPGRSGSLDDGLMGSQFKLALFVKSDGKARNGTPLSGKYVLAAKDIMRLGGDWKVAAEIHWEKFPDGIIDSKAAAAMAFESYVAEHGTLPPRTPAPEIEFTTLEGEKKMKLSELRGKVVVLDFWATWCGPCQGPMAELQQVRQEHADWKDRVAIVPLSIDDTLDIVRKHVSQRGWTNTFNVWAGAGGWRSTPAATFRVTGVPTSYIIDPEGKIVWAGHPHGKSLADTVTRLLKPHDSAP